MFEYYINKQKINLIDIFKLPKIEWILIWNENIYLKQYTYLSIKVSELIITNTKCKNYLIVIDYVINWMKHRFNST